MKKRTKSARKVKVSTAPSVPKYAIWTDELTDSWMLLWGHNPAKGQPNYEAAVAAADKKIRESDRVRLVGIYKLVATVRPDRTPITTSVEKKDG